MYLLNHRDVNQQVYVRQIRQVENVTAASSREYQGQMSGALTTGHRYTVGCTTLRLAVFDSCLEDENILK